MAGYFNVFLALFFLKKQSTQELQKSPGETSARSQTPKVRNVLSPQVPSLSSHTTRSKKAMGAFGFVPESTKLVGPVLVLEPCAPSGGDTVGVRAGLQPPPRNLVL